MLLDIVGGVIVAIIVAVLNIDSWRPFRRGGIGVSDAEDFLRSGGSQTVAGEGNFVAGRDVRVDNSRHYVTQFNSNLNSGISSDDQTGQIVLLGIVSTLICVGVTALAPIFNFLVTVSCCWCFANVFFAILGVVRISSVWRGFVGRMTSVIYLVIAVVMSAAVAFSMSGFEGVDYFGESAQARIRAGSKWIGFNSDSGLFGMISDNFKLRLSDFLANPKFAFLFTIFVTLSVFCILFASFLISSVNSHIAGFLGAEKYSVHQAGLVSDGKIRNKIMLVTFCLLLCAIVIIVGSGSLWVVCNWIEDLLTGGHKG